MTSVGGGPKEELESMSRNLSCSHPLYKWHRFALVKLRAWMEHGKCLWAYRFPKVTPGNIVQHQSPESPVCMTMTFDTEQSQVTQVCLMGQNSLYLNELLSNSLGEGRGSARRGWCFSLTGCVAVGLPFAELWSL